MIGRRRFKWHNVGADPRAKLAGSSMADFEIAVTEEQAVAGHERQKWRKKLDNKWDADDRKTAKAKAKVTLPTLKFMR